RLIQVEIDKLLGFVHVDAEILRHVYEGIALVVAYGSAVEGAQTEHAQKFFLRILAGLDLQSCAGHGRRRRREVFHALDAAISDLGLDQRLDLLLRQSGLGAKMIKIISLI